MPGYAPVQAIEVGEIRITYLGDGGGRTVPSIAFPASGEDGWATHLHHLDAQGQFVTSVGGFLVETGDRRVVVDTGIGPHRIEFPGVGYFEGGRYLQSFAETGFSRADVTDVVYTHLHLDHCGWTTVVSDGERVLTFPSARHLATGTEWSHWAGGTDPAGPDREAVQKPLEDRIEAVTPGTVTCASHFADAVFGRILVGTAGRTWAVGA